jgi:hypothetical protein
VTDRATITNMIPPANEELTPNESLEDKEARRLLVAALTAGFLANGGAIQVLPSCTFSEEKELKTRADLDLRKPKDKTGPKDMTKKAPDFELHKKVRI